jgi:hypothetical protein
VLCPPGLDGEGALLGAIEWAAQCMEQKRTAPDTREGQ